MKIYYNSDLKKLSRELRKFSTDTEIILWNRLKRRQLGGYQFSRQKPIGNFIVDFYCYKLRLIIEVDGSSHDGRETKDAKRQKEIEELGLNFLRFRDTAVRKEIDTVVQIINNYITQFENTN